MDTTLPLLNRWTGGEDVLASHLNEVVDAAIIAGIGVEVGSVNDSPIFPVPDIPPAYTKARLVITSTQLLSGLANIDGKKPLPGDYILVATGGTPGTDGLYRASSGNWSQIVRLNYKQAGKAPIYPHGTLISVWDGNTAPRVFEASVSGFPTFGQGAAAGQLVANAAQAFVAAADTDGEIISYSSGDIDFKTTQTITLPVQDAKKFFFDSVDILVTVANAAVTTQPTFTVGITGNTTKYLAATTPTLLTSLNKRQAYSTLLADDGESTIVLAITSAGASTGSYRGKIVAKGLRI